MASELVDKWLNEFNVKHGYNYKAYNPKGTYFIIIN